jgi:hypothetical protein
MYPFPNFIYIFDLNVFRQFLRFLNLLYLILIVNYFIKNNVATCIYVPISELLKYIGPRCIWSVSEAFNLLYLILIVNIFLKKHISFEHVYVARACGSVSLAS